MEKKIKYLINKSMRSKKSQKKFVHLIPNAFWIFRNSIICELKI